ncbi:MAG: cytochrome P450 [Myxococcota bacterium]|nr:cytochrome P450 [Myxococcota bacterium]
MPTAHENDPWLGANPLDPAFRDDPYPALKRLRESQPVHQAPFGMWRLTRYDDIERLLREVRAGVRRSDGTRPGEESTGGSEFMLQQDPPDHTRLRKLVSKAFTPRAIERWRPRAEAIVEELLDRVEAKGELDVIADLALPVPSTLICEMLGVPVEDRASFTVWTADATHGLAAQMSPPDVVERAAQAAEQLEEYFEDLIQSRRQEPREDLLSDLIRAEEAGDRLSRNELLSQSIGLLIAGFETTIGLIGNGVRALIRHPRELEKLRRDPGLIESAVEECLRYDGPIPLTVRILHEDAEFAGVRVPKDAQVFAMLAAANRDPEVFQEPDRFDIERRDNRHLAFGGGTHFCLGTHLARLEAQLAIGGLVRRLPGLELVNEKVEWGPSLFRVPGRLPVRFRS